METLSCHVWMNQFQHMRVSGYEMRYALEGLVHRLETLQL